MIKIEVPKSSSSNFIKAVNLAKKITEISWSGEARKSSYSITMDFNKLITPLHLLCEDS